MDTLAPAKEQCQSASRLGPTSALTAARIVLAAFSMPLSPPAQRTKVTNFTVFFVAAKVFNSL